MNRRFYLPKAQTLFKEIGVLQISFDKLSFGRNRFTMAFFQVVINDHVVARLYQLFRDNAADVTGAACNQNIHINYNFYTPVFTLPLLPLPFVFGRLIETVDWIAGNCVAVCRLTPTILPYVVKAWA